MCVCLCVYVYVCLCIVRSVVQKSKTLLTFGITGSAGEFSVGFKPFDAETFDNHPLSDRIQR